MEDLNMIIRMDEKTFEDIVALKNDGEHFDSFVTRLVCMGLEQEKRNRNNLKWESLIEIV
jgi:hypothetical protein